VAVMRQIKEFLANLTVIFLISFVISLIAYLLLLDKKHKPSTFKQFELEYFLNLNK
tara:strand:+ start:466 stop:633 length:168 start_codon:yes stop_codon:yes gene_type:complete